MGPKELSCTVFIHFKEIILWWYLQVRGFKSSPNAFLENLKGPCNSTEVP